MKESSKEPQISNDVIDIGLNYINELAQKNNIDPNLLIEAIATGIKSKNTIDKSKLPEDNLTGKKHEIQYEKEPKILRQCRIGWAGKVINGQHLDWLGLDTLTGTESRHFLSEFEDGNDSAKKVLMALSMNIINQEMPPGHTLPITHMTLVSVSGREVPPMIRPTALIIAPEKIFNINNSSYRVGEEAFVATSTYLSRPDARLSDEYAGCDYFAGVRKPILFSMQNTVDRVKSKYGDKFEIDVYDKSKLVQKRDITLPLNWGLVRNEKFEELYIPLLSAILKNGKRVLDSGNYVLLRNIFDGNPSSIANMQNKLDFMRLVYDLSGRSWHFSTNPITTKHYSNNGIVFVDDIFLKHGQPKNNNYKTLSVTDQISSTGKLGQITDIIKKIVLKPAQSSHFADNPNTHLVSARKEISKILAE